MAEFQKVQDEEDDAYDPLMACDPGLGDASEDANAGETEAEPGAMFGDEVFEPRLGDPQADHSPKSEADDRPAEIRIAELFDKMRPHRRTLLEILRTCKAPTAVEEAFRAAERAQSAHLSVFDGEALCNLLVRAGALERIEPQGQEPQVEEADGVRYLKPAEKMQVAYRTTPEGENVVEADKPLEQMTATLEKEPEYKPIYLRILIACSEDGGKTAKELGALVDHDPLLQEPRRWAAYFFGALGECGALTWDGTWRTTETGLAGIEVLRQEGVVE